MRLRQNFEAGDKSTPRDVPGTLAGEEPPDEIKNPSLPWAGDSNSDDGSFLDP